MSTNVKSKLIGLQSLESKIVTALAFVFWYAGIKRCGAFTAAAFSGMMPFTSMILSVLILGEYSGWQQCIGGGLVISGMILIGRKPASIFQSKEQKV